MDIRFGPLEESWQVGRCPDCTRAIGQASKLSKISLERGSSGGRNPAVEQVLVQRMSKAIARCHSTIRKLRFSYRLEKLMPSSELLTNILGDKYIFFQRNRQRN